jgi:hypothetical protein
MVSTALTSGATVYVPVYSSLYLGLNKRQMVELAATVSVRNVSAVHPILIEWVRYFDSAGKQVRDYLNKPSALPPLGSVEFVIQRSDAAGGPGANFLIHWKGPENVDEPLIEAVMLGQSGNAGISFTSPGRAVKSEPGVQSIVAGLLLPDRIHFGCPRAEPCRGTRAAGMRPGASARAAPPAPRETRRVN